MRALRDLRVLRLVPFKFGSDARMMELVGFSEEQVVKDLKVDILKIFEALKKEDPSRVMPIVEGVKWHRVVGRPRQCLADCETYDTIRLFEAGPTTANAN